MTLVKHLDLFFREMQMWFIDFSQILAAVSGVSLSTQLQQVANIFNFNYVYSECN